MLNKIEEKITGIKSKNVIKFSDKSGFVEKLYRKHSGELTSWLRQRYGDGPPEPSDITQIAFAKLAALQDHAHIQNPKAFLFATAINIATSSIGRIIRARQFFQSELDNMEYQVEQITPERVLEDKRRLEIINAAIAALPEKQREILIRSRIEGKTYIEIRKETGWSKAAISRHLNAGLAALQKALDTVENAENTDNTSGDDLT
ncbi:RNA polymerase sigma factor [Paremcibacter congregatus]|uniref:RNA polymerase subunit sigma-70 n=1 Tax=Paremcibacter congregatus TaxID=2043170 RepID=A0A2G4YR82_9PROT|nr:sigma-70 family RNA polymerase sigma factor [Paremcibacter congregatus]PHZ84780.1 RNA polymerase subunit sigma-70 [Paremcibacter congregatus]QDE26233.1 sigma-70 family RNA polymerase sigma factor [Paremcibacter congregatus]